MVEGIQLVHRELTAGSAIAANNSFIPALIAAVTTAATSATTGDFLIDLHNAVSVISVRGSGKLFAIVSSAIAVDLAADPRAAFDNMTPNGGTVRGVTVLVSDLIPNGDVIFVDATQLSIDAGIVTLATSNAAALQLDDDPAAGAQNLTSLYQTNTVALRSERRISHKVLRDTAVAMITAPDCSPGVSP